MLASNFLSLRNLVVVFLKNGNNNPQFLIIPKNTRTSAVPTIIIKIDSNIRFTIARATKITKTVANSLHFSNNSIGEVFEKRIIKLFFYNLGPQNLACAYRGYSKR
ncbi:MAG TPA: hypothetical protein VE573_00085 [Nitrososphaeraceae archaeon]|nr:hypothetical protein [Nitrososphaeraceae archaeon]